MKCKYVIVFETKKSEFRQTMRRAMRAQEFLTVKEQM